MGVRMRYAKTLRKGRAGLLRVVSAVLLASSIASAGTPLPDLSGTWVQVQIFSEIADFPILGKLTRTTTLVLRLQVEQEGPALRIRETYCAAEVDSGTFLVSTTLPEPFLRSLGGPARRASLEPGDGGLRFVQPWVTDVRGARLKDPEKAPLPTSDTDPRVFDSDGDGKPGFTARAEIFDVAAVEAYVVQRVRYRLEGVVTSPDRIEGLIAWTDEHTVLGTKPRLPWTDAPGTPDPTPERSRFVMVPIDPTVDCAAVGKKWKHLFTEKGITLSRKDRNENAR